MGFPGGLTGKRICLQCGRSGFDPWVGKIPWRKEWLSTPVFWPGEFHGLYSPCGCKELDTTEWLSLSRILFAWNVPLVSLIVQKRSLVFPILFFSSISLHWSLRKSFLPLLTILWNSAFKWMEFDSKCDFTPLTTCWVFSFALGCGISFFGGIQHFPVDDFPVASCNLGVLTGEDECRYFYSAVFLVYRKAIVFCILILLFSNFTVLIDELY